MHEEGVPIIAHNTPFIPTIGLRILWWVSHLAFFAFGIVVGLSI